MLTAALFQQPPMPHHCNAVSYFGNNSKVMRDEQHCEIELLLQIAQQLEHLSLHCYVQRRGGFVCYQKLWPVRECHGY